MKAEKIKEFLEQKKTLKCQITGVQVCEEDPTQDQLMINVSGSAGFMSRADIDVIYEKGDLAKMIGKNISCRIIGFYEDGSLVLSRREILEEQREVVIEELNTGVTVKAKVLKVNFSSAYLFYKGTILILNNADFSTIDDRTPVSEVLESGQEVEVVLAKVSATKRIHVAMAEKYESPTKFKLETFKPDQIVLGTVVTVKPHGCYVRIAPGLDALCPIPTYKGVITYEPVMGDKVKIRLTQVRNDEDRKRVRAKIQGVVTEDDASMMTEENVLEIKSY